MTETTQIPQWISAVVAVLTLLVLTWAAIAGGKQLKIIQEQNRTTQEQNRLSRIVEWKSSIQETNKLILEDPDKFVPIFYPGKSPEDVLRITGAFTNLNTFEIIFHMRKDQDPKQFKELLKTYILHNEPIKELWGEKEYRDAFTSEFQDAVNDILPKSSQG